MIGGWKNIKEKKTILNYLVNSSNALFELIDRGMERNEIKF